MTVTNLGTGEKRIATTDGQGNYQVLSLPRGDYKVEVNAPGFKQFVRNPIDVSVAQEARVNVQMVIGEQNQQVVVTGAPPIMQTDSASLGTVVEGKAVQTLPLNGRNVLNLVALVPGVVPQGGASTNLSGQNVFAAGNYQIVWRQLQSVRGAGRWRVGEHVVRQFGPTGDGSGFHPGIQCPDSQQHGGIRQLQRRRDQHEHEVGHERIPRHGLRVPAKYRARRQ